MPAWADAWIAESSDPLATTTADFATGVAATARHGLRYSGVTARIDHARQRNDLDLQHAVVRAYELIREALTHAPDGPRTPLRFWNFVPGIVNETGGDLDRYMVFNAGRFAAFADWFRDTSETTFNRSAFNQRIPTATGVGHAGDDLIVHVLAAAVPGKPIENPRQRAAYRYSARYGPLPPCFARATLVPGVNQAPRHLLIGGTASVCGETSVFNGDLKSQTAETFRNLEALIRAAGGKGLESLISLRAYHTHLHHRDALQDAVDKHAAFFDAPIEWIHAPLCRRDLDIEIEGVASI